MAQDLINYTPEQQRFLVACEQASALDLTDNVAAAFGAVQVVKALKDVLSDKFLDEYIMPLQNTTIGFLTDHTGRPNGKGQPTQNGYTREVVRECLIDALSHGLLPTGNQFNIIAGRMYPTKEGFTALLAKLGAKYQISTSIAASTMQGFANLLCKISYSYKGEKQTTTLPVQVKADAYSSPDQLKGKAERRAKKWLYEFLTNIDMGEGDVASSEETIDEQVQPDPTEVQAKKAASVEEKKAAMRAKLQPEQPPVNADDDMPLFNSPDFER